MNAKLTAKETALMTAIADRFFSFFDDGLVEDSGIWTEDMTHEITGATAIERYNVSTSQRGAASVINSLCRKGLLRTVEGRDSDEGAWTVLTAAGEAWVTEFNTVPGAPTVTRLQLSGEMAEPVVAAEAAPESEVVEAPAAAPVFAKGDVVNSKDGNQYVVRRVNANGTIRIVAADGSKFNRKAETLTKA